MTMSALFAQNISRQSDRVKNEKFNNHAGRWHHNTVDVKMSGMQKRHWYHVMCIHWSCYHQHYHGNQINKCSAMKSIFMKQNIQRFCICK